MVCIVYVCMCTDAEDRYSRVETLYIYMTNKRALAARVALYHYF
jgi:hypothetical protein